MSDSIKAKVVLPKKTTSYSLSGKKAVVRVIDGDSIEISNVGWFPKPLQDEITVRVYGIDTPETSLTKALSGQAEVDLGMKSKEYAKAWVASELSKPKASVILKITGSIDKYGRFLCDLSINRKSFANEMISKGYARPYLGGKKEPWTL
jgi:endonuclease YncB( thermonuclease family)